MARLILDANNFFRRELETYTDGSALRGVLNRFFHTDTPTIICWDGHHANKRRRDIFPDYKVKRKKAGTDIYMGFDQIREVLKHCPVVQIRCDGYEADDVIATIAQPGDHINSTDLDLRQIEGCTFEPEVKIPCDLEYLRTFKTLVGDGADSIPGCKGFGEGAWNRESPQKWTEWLKAGLAGETLPAVDLPSRCKPDWDELRKYWEIVDFIAVPQKDIAAGLTVGQRNFVAADNYLRSFLL